MQNRSHLARRSHPAQNPGLTLAAIFFLFLPGCTGTQVAHAFLGSPNLPCVPPGGVQSILAYPAQNATGIPDTFRSVIFASSSALQPPYKAFIVDNTNGATYYFQSFSPLQGGVPNPSVTPGFSNPVYQESINYKGVTFPQGHNVSVYLDQVNCQAVVGYGNFTVQ